jgi:outer membrane protein OmpA-like peptidoglycan-associated protein
MKKSTIQWLLLGLISGACVASSAQPVAPSAQEIIEQLKSPSPGPRLRSLRNLAVESVSPAAPGTTAAATEPSQSVQTAADKNTATAPAARPSLSLLIQFDFNSARIRPESQQALLNLSQALNAAELADSKFAVEGHTDAKGLPDYNLKLSQQRAEAVQTFLAQKGVALARLTAAGKGASQLANAANPLGAENRRVRIVNLD